MDGKPSKPGRRAFLVLGVSAVLAGCVGRSGGSGDSTTMRDEELPSSSKAPTTLPDRTPTGSAKQTPTTKATTPEATTRGTVRDGTDDDSVEIDSNDTFPQTTATIGDNDPSADGSATILVWNDAETARKIRVAITERNSGASVFRKTYQLEADAFIEIELTTPGNYTLEVGVDGDEPTTVDFFVDTCNSERITVAVRGDGTVNWEWLSTAVGCR